MTPNEVFRYLKGKQAEDRLRMQERALMDYKLANLIMIGFHDHKSFPKYSSFYSFLEEEQVDAEEMKRQERERKEAESEARLRAFAESFNARRKEVEKD